MARGIFNNLVGHSFLQTVMVELKDYINYLIGEKIPKTDSLELLRKDTRLTREEKNLIFAYCYPRQLLDRELPSRVQEFFKNNGNPRLTPSIPQATLYVEAFRTEQYGRFMRHLYHSFVDNPELIAPVSGEGKCECPLCGKELLELNLWEKSVKQPEEEENKEFLAYGSKESGITLCKDCLVQLMLSKCLIEDLDPHAFSPKPEKSGWDRMKL